MVTDGLLKRAWESPDGKQSTMRLGIPRCRALKVVQEVHNGMSGVYLDVNNTLAKTRGLVKRLPKMSKELIKACYYILKKNVVYV